MKLLKADMPFNFYHALQLLAGHEQRGMIRKYPTAGMPGPMKYMTMPQVTKRVGCKLYQLQRAMKAYR